MKNGQPKTAAQAEAGEGGGGGGGRRCVRGAAMLTAKLVAVALACALVVYVFDGMFLLQLALVALVAYLASGGRYRWFYVAAVTAPRDLKALYRFIRLSLQIKYLMRNNITIGDLVRQNAKKHPKKVCFIYENDEWTFAQVEEYSNKVANLFKNHGYQKGDVVALMLENCPEFVCLWVGLAKLGIVVPLINHNLRKHPLQHSITASKSQAIIFGSEFTSAIKDIADQLPANMGLYRWSATSSNVTSELGEKDLTALLADASPSVPENVEKVNVNDPLIYIFTSGTTGLPKAAVLTHIRYVFITAAIAWLSGFKAKDRFYTPLPLYHTAGGNMTVGQALVYGSTVVIRKKFSASSYFPDVRKYECTIAQYIGEMCRYILSVPVKPDDKDHKLRMLFGNGLRPQIWTTFVKRFNVPRIAEFYGATEGNANIVNIDNTVGAIGFVSRIIPSVYPISVIRVDQETGEPIRNEKGLCIPCKPGEPGVFIGKIIKDNPGREFLGYVDKEASSKKIVRDVFRKGDAAFLSGDIIEADEFGYLFFKDRTGDTFRWKGENVSTSEVEAVISNVIKYRDAIAYGVEIRGMEGRAGMVAVLDPDDSLDFEAFAEGVKQSLPSYARPLFIRKLPKIDLTGTFKLKKKDLQDEGFNPNIIKDKLFYLTPKGSYELLTAEVFSQIENGKIRF